MHSVRETAGSQDVDHIVNLFKGFFNNYTQLAAKIYVD